MGIRSNSDKVQPSSTSTTTSSSTKPEKSKLKNKKNSDKGGGGGETTASDSSPNMSSAPAAVLSPPPIVVDGNTNNNTNTNHHKGGLKKFFKRSSQRKNSSNNNNSQQPQISQQNGDENQPHTEGATATPEQQPQAAATSSSSAPANPSGVMSSLSASRSQRALQTQKKGKRGVGLLAGLLPKKNKQQQQQPPLPPPHPATADAATSTTGLPNGSSTTARSSSALTTNSTQSGSGVDPNSPQIRSMSTGFSATTQPVHNMTNSPIHSNPTVDSANKRKQDLFQWQDEMEELAVVARIQQKQLIKERDGFCRRVDLYDGQVIHVEGKPAYELGNYLGGGVAGVVYEGHRLQPIDEYPVRSGAYDKAALDVHQQQQQQHPAVVNTNQETAGMGDLDSITVSSLLCMPEHSADCIVREEQQQQQQGLRDRDPSLLTLDSHSFTDAASFLSGSPQRQAQQQPQQQQQSQTPQAPVEALTEDIALEATRSDSNHVLIDRVDAPSRSKHFAAAVKQNHHAAVASTDGSTIYPSDASFTGGGIMEETVAVKILNPVGFRTLAASATQTAVVARPGDALEAGIMQGTRPMEERHVWWLVNPSSRNLRTLQRYNVGGPRTVEVDRGCAEKGLRISLVASYKDPATGHLRELPLTRCIEIWGHVPFGASDEEFQHVMDSIDRINQGQPPPPEPAFLRDSGVGMVPGRVGTETTGETGCYSSTTATQEQHSATATTATNQSSTTGGVLLAGVAGDPIPMDGTSKRTGIYRAAFTERQTVFCQELNAYIAIPATPSKYLKWLRQRRAATKEIRNMMRIGRHRNVVHLFEVLELIQENKSTMFLILELVRGGELFDLISSNAAKISEKDKIPAGFSESETVMRKFFQELASGVNYCHQNGIAHRDLKPENLLVHNSRSGDCVLKIADFGLSAVFGNVNSGRGGGATPTNGGGGGIDQETVIESVISGGDGTYARQQQQQQLDSSMDALSPTSAGAAGASSPSSLKESMDKLFSASGTALSFLTCGAVEGVMANCNPSSLVGVSADGRGGPSPLKRMTSVVGSPHYVAPEIISQSDSRRHKNKNKDNANNNNTNGDGTNPSNPTAADAAAGANNNSSKQPPKGYDGTKADVWSAGVILYAMLFRSLPFGEDLLRCPRFQSYRKWYDNVRRIGSNRRTDIAGALDPVISDQDERDFLGPHWFFPSSSSRESRDLIVYMLNPDPDVRPTIEHVLRHPWLLKEA